MDHCDEILHPLQVAITLPMPEQQLAHDFGREPVRLAVNWDIVNSTVGKLKGFHKSSLWHTAAEMLHTVLFLPGRI